MMLTIIKILNQIGGVGVILTVGGSFIKYNSKKGWKCRKNASNREKFFFLFLKNSLRMADMNVFSYLCCTEIFHL